MAKARQETGQFLIEGLHLVGAALEQGWDLDVLLYAPDLLTSPFGRHLTETFSGPKEELSREVFESIAGKENPQGLIGIARARRPAIESIVPSGTMLALERPQDAGNVGTILRTIDAVGGTALFLLDGGVDPFHPAAIRAAMGTTFSVPLVQCSSDEFLRWCVDHAVYVLGTSARAETPYRELIPARTWVLLLGSEQKGLSEKLARTCNAVVALPMRGKTSSLNLAVAAGILLYWYCG